MLCLAQKKTCQVSITNKKRETKWFYLGKIKARVVRGSLIIIIVGRRRPGGGGCRGGSSGRLLGRATSFPFVRVREGLILLEPWSGSGSLLNFLTCASGKGPAGSRGSLNVLDWGLSSRRNQDVKTTADFCTDGADCACNRMFHPVCFKKYQGFFKACSEQIGASVVACDSGGVGCPSHWRGSAHPPCDGCGDTLAK